MLICAVAIVPVLAAAKLPSLWESVALISLAVAGHQGWSANLLTLPSDMFAKNAVASVVSVGTFAGCISGAMISTVAGWLLQVTGNYVPLFMFAAFTYLVALSMIHGISPRLQAVRA
jgi:ACS family hexuronate transporter-like MFS transporter